MCVGIIWQLFYSISTHVQYDAMHSMLPSLNESAQQEEICRLQNKSKKRSFKTKKDLDLKFSVQQFWTIYCSCANSTAERIQAKKSQLKIAKCQEI